MMTRCGFIIVLLMLSVTIGAAHAESIFLLCHVEDRSRPDAPDINFDINETRVIQDGINITTSSDDYVNIDAGNITFGCHKSTGDAITWTIDRTTGRLIFQLDRPESNLRITTYLQGTCKKVM
jgi:hypothetical protein